MDTLYIALVGVFLAINLSCGLEKGKHSQWDQLTQEKLRKKVIRRNRFRDVGGFSHESGIQDEQKYLDFLKGAVISDADWLKIQGEQLRPVYALDQLEGAYFGDFFTSKGDQDSLYLEMDINHAKFLTKSTDRLPEAENGQKESRFHVGELFGNIGKDQSVVGNQSVKQNSMTDSIQIRHVYLRYAPSKRMVAEVISGKNIKDIGIKAEDFMLSKGYSTSAFVDATIGSDCSVSSFLQGMENPWEDAGEVGIPINVINIFVKLDHLEDRRRIRDLVKVELEKCSLEAKYEVSNTEESKFQLSPNLDSNGYLGSMEAYQFVPVRPEDPTIPSNSTFHATEVETRACSMLFPYKSQSRKNLEGEASDSYPLLTEDDGLETNFSVAVFTLLILGKTIDQNGEEVLHVKYSPMAIRTFPAKWDVVNTSGILMRIKYKDPIDVAKSMVTSSKKLMTGVFFGFNTDEPEELGPFELRDKVASLRSVAKNLSMPVLPPEDVGEAAYEQILYRALSDMFLYLGKHSGAKMIALKKVKN